MPSMGITVSNYMKEMLITPPLSLYIIHVRYRYLRSPQDYLAAGDAYTHRYDMIKDRVAKNGVKK